MERENFATQIMCEKLQQLQKVKTRDVRDAHVVVYGGISALDLLRNPSAVEFVHGCNLAMRVHKNRWHLEV